ncbi:Hypothetical protein NTJ_00745 [Nesidiocoris tenuis]|uniref:Uncharacterized protein n=1 Tax=Nesidiocoris tenuis TaxID=355587 RepID=A0ABN7A7K7_9HEMI|nr:Hypothetical protein NTJ_00745 [Nesidiocoris tenuis]
MEEPGALSVSALPAGLTPESIPFPAVSRVTAPELRDPANKTADRHSLPLTASTMNPKIAFKPDVNTPLYFPTMNKSEAFLPK